MAVEVPRAIPPAKGTGRARPALATIFIIGYLGLGIVFVFLGGYTLLFSALFSLDVLLFGMFLFIGIGVLSFLSVYGFLKGGRWAARYITLTGVCGVIGGALLSLSTSIGLVSLGGLAIVLGAGTLAYLRFGNVRSFLGG